MTSDVVLKPHLKAVVAELISAGRRDSRASESAYLTAAVHLRTLVGTGKGNNLLERVIPGATLHRLAPIPPEVLEGVRQGHNVYYQPGTMKFRGKLARVDLKWDRRSGAMPVEEWRKQTLLVALHPVSVGQFVQKMGDQRGAHIDAELKGVIEAVRTSGKFIVIGGEPIKPERLYTLAIARYVASRARRIIAEAFE